MKYKRKKNNFDLKTLIARIRDGEEKTCQEWATLYTPYSNPIMARASFQSTISALKKRRKCPIFLAPSFRNGPLIEIDSDPNNGEALVRSKNYSLGTARNFFNISERIVDEQPDRGKFVGTQLGEYMVELGTRMAYVGKVFEDNNIKLLEKFKQKDIKLLNKAKSYAKG